MLGAAGFCVPFLGLWCCDLEAAFRRAAVPQSSTRGRSCVKHGPALSLWHALAELAAPDGHQRGRTCAVASTELLLLSQCRLCGCSLRLLILRRNSGVMRPGPPPLHVGPEAGSSSGEGSFPQGGGKSSPFLGTPELSRGLPRSWPGAGPWLVSCRVRCCVPVQSVEDAP